MARTVSIHELATFQGEGLGRTGWTPVTQQMIDAFAEATGDHQWVHVDVERARQGPFGATIAHGYLLLSIVPIMLKELLLISDSGRGVNYGVDRLRFTSPVPSEGEVALEASVSFVQERPDGGTIYAVDFVLHLRGADRPAAIGRTLYGVYPASTVS